jgi:hypothetical protein
MDRTRVLLSEGSSLTAREHLSVMGPAGIDIGVAASNRLAIARFSRWCHDTMWVPRSADDPKMRPGRSQALATGAVRDYAVPPGTVRRPRMSRPGVACSGVQAVDAAGGRAAHPGVMDPMPVMFVVTCGGLPL